MYGSSNGGVNIGVSKVKAGEANSVRRSIRRLILVP
jgi:hypothetical protein